MSASFVTYTGNGSQTDFTFPFNYLATTDVFVFVNDVSVPYSWINTSAIRVTPAPASGVPVRVRRVTQKNSVPVNFTDGAVLLETDLDTLAAYAMFSTQEAHDTVGFSLQKDSLNVYQAGGRRIANVGDPVFSQDATTKAYLEGPFTTQLTAGPVGEAIQAAEVAVASAAYLSSYMDSVIMNITFPLDCGLITDPVITNSFDLGAI